MTIAKLNRDGMGDHLNRADLRSGDSMVVLFQRPKPVDRNALNEDGAPDGNLLQLYAPAKIPPES